MSFNSSPGVAAVYLTILAHPVISATVIFLVYEIGKARYRLYFHPLAEFPGPKLSAVTRWLSLFEDYHCPAY
jgi:hypothetical protein